MSEQKFSKIQAREITYELHSLGWKGFQGLCNTVAAEIWGQTVQGFFDSHDGGRDGAFYGTWQQKDREVFEGSFTVQCKFTSAADKQIRPADLTDELAKARLLAARGLADNYFLFTNFRLQGTTEAEISRMFETIPGIKKCKVYGCERISQMIQESPRLRMLVPRIYGLGDLIDTCISNVLYYGAEVTYETIGNPYSIGTKTSASNRPS